MEELKWYYEYSDEVGGRLWIDIGGKPRAYDFHMVEHARLAAASPTLLHALEEAVEALEYNIAWFKENGQVTKDDEIVVALGRGAIDLATRGD